MFSLWIYHQEIPKSIRFIRDFLWWDFYVVVQLEESCKTNDLIIFARKLWVFVQLIFVYITPFQPFSISLQPFHMSGCQRVLFSLTTNWCLWNHVANIRFADIYSMGKLSPSQRVGRASNSRHLISVCSSKYLYLRQKFPSTFFFWDTGKSEKKSFFTPPFPCHSEFYVKRKWW